MHGQYRAGAVFGHARPGSAERWTCDLVAVAAAVFVLGDVFGLDEIGDDAVGGALGDARPGRDVAQPHARVVGDAQQHPGVVGQATPVGHACTV